ncbi:tol-pal system protein YbgF [Jannaschia pohangensis]|uniref:Cell division coordinator CpoB n=1 Tax=Jannaschia pohangensis TaxID=390807 RepID=A0A1I3LZA2_9RHOB|nr:tol-pal system protein YbgF [Jannaschia pohangensis]SFI89880.1 tol-pal system protein YbgF [Jannaschia pohangensis]
MLRAATLALALTIALPVAAQQSETLADIRQQLSVLQSEMQLLGRELNTTGATGGAVSGSTVLDRVNAIETELQRLTQATERLQFRVESVARDGGNRIEDLRFQLCELTPDCDLASLPAPAPLGQNTGTPAPAGGTTGGGTSSSGPLSGPVPVQRPDRTGGTVAQPPVVAGTGTGTDIGIGATGGQTAPVPELAVGEQGDFDRARAALDSGDNAAAAQAFEQFVTSYPTGPLTAEAQFLRGQALSRDGQHAGAARAYLESFSGTPEGPQAPQALVGLGTSLGALGQRDEACLTLSEVAIRFPQSPAVEQANSARAGLGCAG